MKAKEDFVLYSKDFIEYTSPIVEMENLINIYVICDNSFESTLKFDIKKFVNDLCSSNEIQNLGEIKTNFTFEEIISLKKDHKEIYIISEQGFQRLLKGIKKSSVSNTCLFDIKGEKVIYFLKEYKFISFKSKIIGENQTKIIQKNKNCCNLKNNFCNYSINKSVKNESNHTFGFENKNCCNLKNNFCNHPTNENIKHDPNHALGLDNIGASCYLNATLQCLCNIKLLKDYFLNDDIYINEIMTRNATLTKGFAEVIRKLWANPNGDKSYSPISFKKIIGEMNPLFQGSANDSKDLLLFLYQNIHEELNNPKKNKIENPFENEFMNIFGNEFMNIYEQFNILNNENNSIISRTFYNFYYNISECQACKFKNTNIYCDNFFSFPLENVRLYMKKLHPNESSVVTLDDCFVYEERDELISGYNQMYCSHCGRETNGLSYNKLLFCPDVLTIVLNRGKGKEFKVDFSFPLNISIEKYVKINKPRALYELIGVLFHFGECGPSGHFVAYCKSPVDNKWYFYNDAIVTPCQENIENEIQSKKDPYILFYQRNEHLSPNIINLPQIVSNKSFSDETFFAVRFFLVDHSINYPVACKYSFAFSRLERKLFLEYPELKIKNIYYTVDNKIIDKETTVRQNGIKDGDTIIINFEKEEEVMAIQFISSEQDFTYPIACKKNDIVLDVEAKLFAKYPDLKKKNIYYTANGRILKKEDSLEKNGIENGFSILVNYVYV